jgi:PAS domain S-box-containing protein
MKLFWKIYCAVLVAFVTVITLSSYVTSAKRISQAEKSIAEQHRVIGSLVSSDTERSRLESKWPFESLRRLSEHPDFIFWWIVGENGIIHLADKASFIGSYTGDYFPQVTDMFPDGEVLLNKRKKYGLFIKTFRAGNDRWAFWLGFSTEAVSKERASIIFTTVAYSASASLALGLVLYLAIIHFVSPVKSLTAGAERIGKGDLNHRVEVKSNDELGYLACSFNKMAEDLKRTTASIDDLNREISERVKAEATLQKSENKYRTLIENLPQRVFSKDRNSIYVSCNENFARDVGIRPEEFKGKTDYDFFPKELAEKYRQDDKRVMETGRAENIEEKYVRSGQEMIVHTVKTPIKDEQGNIAGILAIFWDITDLKHAQEELQKTQERLLEASRMAGMAEVAADVLHNVGNVLNSINVSTTLITGKVTNSEVANLEKVARIINEHIDEIGTFLTEHPQGKHIPVYLTEVSKCLQAEQTDIISKLQVLTGNVQHIKDIISMQQAYAKVSGVEVQVSLSRLMEDAIRINSAGLQRHGTRLIREFEELPDVEIDKQKVLQILVNLISNAKYALSDSKKRERLVTIRIYKHSEDHLRIEVADNGVGIPQENLTKIFSHGFTTKEGGHGFGLHGSALAASQMGGSLRVHSDGVEQGATFTLELPFKPIKVVS